MPGVAQHKQEYLVKLRDLLQEYSTVLVCGVDMVTSNQIQKIRMALRGKAVLLMGKNTLIRKGLREYAETDASVERLIPHVKMNVGLLFTNATASDVRDVLNTQRVSAPAREGVIAPLDVTVPKGQTTLAPTETSFMAQLGFSTKINKNAIEILSDHQVIKKGNKVTASDAAVLAKLGIMPFTYGLEILQIFDGGNAYSPAILDIKQSQLADAVASAVATIAAIGLGADFPTLASVPHSVIGAFKNVLAVAIETDYDLPEAERMKEMIKNPSAFAAAAPAAAAASSSGAAAPAKKEEKAEEKVEEDEDMGFGLFD